MYIQHVHTLNTTWPLCKPIGYLTVPGPYKNSAEQKKAHSNTWWKCLTTVSGLWMHAVYMFIFLLFSTNLQNPFAVWFGKFNSWYVNTQTIRILVMHSNTAQTLTDTLTLSHGLRISGPNVTFTFRTNCPNDTIFCCKLGDEEYQICNDTSYPRISIINGYMHY